MFSKITRKEILFYVFLFVFLLFVSLITTSFGNDEVWNFGFAKNIYEGLIPYKDFNMIVPPLFPFLMTLPFFVFGANEVVFQVTNVLLLIFMFFLLKKVIGNFPSIFLLFLVFPLSIVFPCYNLFLFFLLVLLIYLEKIEAKDAWIGIVLGLFILTKHTVGGVVFLVAILYQWKNKKKMLQRFLFAMIPVGCFFLYLLITSSFYDFIDQCFLGMFDFGKQSSVIFTLPLILSILMIGEALYFIHKNSKRVENYYVLAFYSILLPMINIYHTQLAFLGCVLITLMNVDLSKIWKQLSLFSIVVAVLSQVIIFIYLPKPILYPNDLNHFEYRYIPKEDVETMHMINQYLEDHKKEEIIFLAREAYFIRIVNDQKIQKLDLINHGNSGYHGAEKNIKLIQKHKDALFITYEKDARMHGQTDEVVVQYILDNGKKVGELGIYSIFSLE